ncbi:zinc-dependent alcohol dehydrogenase family protein [Terrilactibacillus sp. S3-3]|nr:zinc-dependent alcohol dehydrogenase family protein [Terrilactibacillus sp. S3-3]
MKALVYEGPGSKEWKDVPKPQILESTDVIVKVTKTTICGTDLHILKGDVPETKPGTILGHEGIGIVEEAGPAVKNFKAGDEVIISCVTSCGRCEYCKEGMYSHCEDGGWILGHLIDGTQAEYVRIPLWNSLYHVPKGVDTDALVMLSDILPTGFEIGVKSGGVKPGDVVAIVGAGPIGISALLTSQFYSPAEIIMIDMDENRLKEAKTFGATHVINSRTEDPVKRIFELTENKGVDVAMEAVGIPATFDICQSILKPGGSLANIGVHGSPVELQAQKLWIQNIKITMGLVNTNTTPLLLKTVVSDKIQPEKLITHHFTFDEIIDAYDVFGNAAKEKALKVIISRD